MTEVLNMRAIWGSVGACGHPGQQASKGPCEHCMSAVRTGFPDLGH